MSSNSGGVKFTALRKLDKYLSTTEAVLAGVAYAAMVVIVLAGVIMRYWTKTPNLYGEEISRYLMIACIYLGVAVACKRKLHMNVTMFVDALPKAVGNAITVIVRLVTIGMYAFMTYQGILMVQRLMTFSQASPAMRMPMWIMYAVITLGFALSTVTEIIMFINDFIVKGILQDDSGKEGEKT